MTTKADMLKRVRAALGPSNASGEAPAPPAVPADKVRLAGASDDLVTMFAERAQAVGMEVVGCGAGEMEQAVLGILREAGAGCVVCCVEELETSLREAGLDVPDWRNDASMADEFKADAAVTNVHAALAETGTLVCCADARHGRGLSLAPPLHLAIVSHRDIVPDMLDLFGRWGAASPPSARVLITGPSKTADIEGVLVRGVHGPGRVVIVLASEA